MRKLFVIFLLLVAGCHTPQISTYTKQDIDFSKYKKVAVIKFDYKESSVGQEVSDRVALSFMKKGYNVVERSQLKSIIDENSIAAAGLTETTRSALQLEGVDVLVAAPSRNMIVSKVQLRLLQAEWRWQRRRIFAMLPSLLKC
ncbi:MAG: CsgG/HfaB family protein [Syntrophales bacterium]|jgi:hypothetical protein